jgi:hypothetical protein
MGIRRLFPALLVTACGLVLGAAITTQASPWGWPGTHTTNEWQTYFYYRLNENWIQASSWVRINSIHETDVTTQRVNTHDGSDVAVMDARYKELNGPGWEECDDSPTFGHCAHSHVHFNNIGKKADWERRNIACHEFGHTLGFTDYSGDDNMGSCTNLWSQADKYSLHDKRDHINAHYPH